MHLRLHYDRLGSTGRHGSRQEKPVRHLQGAPVRHLQGAPVRHLQGAPVRHLQGAPIHLSMLLWDEMEDNCMAFVFASSQCGVMNFCQIQCKNLIYVE
ncbi:hypothetical protein Cfor_10808 [Coptotermes formosanus]|uniref:Uncharacterized protein n=1 Tax=Coptotermes formosanus TaxID=36987 RepID=A0A6L2PUQ5_COPFO|nr:hypothetical protein Cfor_10808 [Coptotermes formosanus]